MATTVQCGCVPNWAYQPMSLLWKPPFCFIPPLLSPQTLNGFKSGIPWVVALEIFHILFTPADFSPYRRKLARGLYCLDTQPHSILYFAFRLIFLALSPSLSSPHCPLSCCHFLFSQPLSLLSSLSLFLSPSPSLPLSAQRKTSSHQQFTSKSSPFRKCTQISA